ncbi:AAA family ATPase [Negativibacillus massiliensis]|uniref:AAA family ATPase n=1 Tax=Negativibacillus massiliensis TaxID=1871035 RepID=UPI002A82A6DF|nr:AAA family ATPase [Negativibacillus massiliensis]MDY4048418.1 AAA family ATPase [Negativibacillus massiliensis]
MNLQEVLSHFDGVKRRNENEYIARCPCHDDKKQSLCIGSGEKGVVLKCQAGCDTRAILDRVGLKPADLFFEKKQDNRPQVTATYQYPNGVQKLRRSDKSFTWRRPDGKGGWIYNRKGVPHSLYIAGELSEDVAIVEGEKDADNLHKLGWTAVSGEDGAGPGKWRSEYTEQLLDFPVVIFQDNDDVGKAYAQEVATALSGVAKSIHLLDLSKIWTEIPEHGDVSDLIARFGEKQASDMIAELIRKTPAWAPQNPAVSCAADVPYEEPKWTIAPYFQRGKGTLIQGDSGSGKTAFVCAVAAHVSTGKPLLNSTIETPGNVLVLSVEDDQPILRGRIEASGGDLTKIFFHNNPAGLTFTSPEIWSIVKQYQIKLIIFDPFQAFLGSGIDMFRANETRPVLARLFELCDQGDCAVIIVAHTSKSSDKSAVNRSLGSVDIPASMRSVMQLIRNPDNPDQCIMVHVKSSNAPRGRSIAYTIGDRGGVHWDGYSPIIVEDLGSIAKREKKGIPYDQEPLVQVFVQLITDKPGGGFWSYNDLKRRGTEILGFAPFDSISDLRQRLDDGLSRELLSKDGIMVTHSERGHGNVRGIRIEQYALPKSYQTKISG